MKPERRVYYVNVNGKLDSKKIKKIRELFSRRPFWYSELELLILR